MGFFDSGASEIPLPQMQSYSPTGMGQAESGALGGISNLGSYNTFGQNLGQAGGIAQGMVNNPGAPTWLAGAQQAGNMGTQGGMNAFGAGGSMYGMGGAIANTAFDPQNALYARTLQQTQDQARAGQAVRGIAMTPYGAGLEDQNTRNFNIDWQNQQLQRQIAGGQGAGNAFTTGANLQNMGTQSVFGASALPYTVNQNISQNSLSALGTLGQYGQQAAAIPQQQIADWQNYLGWGTGAQNAANTAQMNQFNAAMGQNAADEASKSGTYKTIGAIAMTAAVVF